MPKGPLLVPPSKYLSNVAKSFVYQTQDYAKELAPETFDFVSTNKEVFITGYSLLKNPRATIKRAVKTFKESKLYEAIDYGTKNLSSDLRSGQWYNRERNEQMSDIAGLSADDFGDLSEFGVNDDWETDLSGNGASESSATEITAGDKKIAGTIEATSRASASATVNALYDTTDKAVKNSRVNTGILYNQNERLFGNLNASINGVHNVLSNMGQMQAKALENLDKNTSKFFTDSLKIHQDNNQMLHKLLEMQTNLYKSAADKEKEELDKRNKKKFTWGDITSNGIPDLKEYFEAVKKNVSEQISSMGIPALSEEGNMLKAMVTSPMQYVTEHLVKKAIPESIAEATKEINETISSVFGTFIATLNNNKGESGLLGQLSKFFGIKVDPSRGIDTSKYEKGQIPFDGITRKAITDVIPSYLGNIEAALTGKPRRIFDFQSGRWTTAKEVADKYNAIKENAIKSATSNVNANMKIGIDTLKRGARDDAEREEINKAVDDLNKYLYEHGTFNPNKSADANGIDASSYFYFYKHYEIMRQLYKSSASRKTASGKVITDYSKLMRISKDSLDAKKSEEAQYRQAERAVGGAMAALAAEGLLGGKVDAAGVWKGVNDSYKAKVEYKNTAGVLTVEDKYHNTVFNYLQNINKELTWDRENVISKLDDIIYDSIKKYHTTGVTSHALGTMGLESISLTNADYLAAHNHQTNHDHQEQAVKDQKKGIAIHMGSISDLDSEDDKDKLKEMLDKVHESIMLQNQVDYLKSKGKFTDNKYKYDEDGNKIEPEEKEDKDDDSEEHQSMVSAIVKRFKEMGSVGKTVGSLTGEAFANVLYTADRAIYNMMYKEELKDEEDAQEYEGFMAFMAHKTTETFKSVRDYIKNEFLQPIKDKLGITDEWQDKVKKNLTEQLYAVGKFFMDANKDVYKPIWDRINDKKDEMVKQGTAEQIKQKYLGKAGYYQDQDGKIKYDKGAAQANWMNRDLLKNVFAYEANLNNKFKITDVNSMTDDELKKAYINLASDEHQKSLRQKDIDKGIMTIDMIRNYVKHNTKQSAPTTTGFADLDQMSDVELQQEYINTGKDEAEKLKRQIAIDNMKNHQDGKPAGWLRQQLLKGIIRYRRNSKNYAEGTMGRPFMGKSMLSKGELLFNSKGVSRVNKTDAYDIDEPTHILNSEDSYVMMKAMGMDPGRKSTIKQDEAAEKAKASSMGLKLASHAEGTGNLGVKIKSSGITSEEFLKEAKAYSAEMTAGGILGGGIGLLLGGPLLGAVIGAGVNLIKGSTTLKDKIFGPLAEDGKSRKGGIISKTIQDNVKKYLPDMAKYGMAGLIPGLLTPLGPLGGLLIGGGIGFLKNNERFTNKYFGEEGKLSIGTKEKEILSKMLPGAGKGALAGALGGLVLGGPFGLVGNMLIGSGLGMMASTDEFKNMILGEPDSDGEREGGLVGVFKDAFRPFTDMVSNLASMFENTVNKAIIEPLQAFIKPAIHALPKLMSAIPRLIGSKLDEWTEGIRSTIGAKVRRFMDPLFDMTGKFVKGIFKPITGLASLPGMAMKKVGNQLRAYNIKNGDLVDMSATEAVEWMTEHDYGHKVGKELRFAAKQKDAGQSKELAKLLDQYGDDEKDLKRKFNKSNRDLNRKLDNFTDANGNKLSVHVRQAIIDAVAKGKTGDVSTILRKYNLMNSKEHLSQEEVNSLMEGDLGKLINKTADLHNRFVNRKNMSDSDMAGMEDKLKGALESAGLKGFDIKNSKSRQLLSSYLKDQATYLEANKDKDNHEGDETEEKIKQDTGNIVESLKEILEKGIKINKGETNDTKEFAESIAEGTEAGRIVNNAKFDKLTDKLLKKNDIDPGLLTNEARNLATPKGINLKGVTANHLNKAARVGVKKLNDIFTGLAPKIRDLMDEEAYETFFNCNETDQKYFLKNTKSGSEVYKVLTDGNYIITREDMILLTAALPDGLDEKCRIINQADCTHEFKSISDINNAGLEVFDSIRKRYKITGLTGSGLVKQDLKRGAWRATKSLMKKPFQAVGLATKLAGGLIGFTAGTAYGAANAARKEVHSIRNGRVMGHSNDYYTNKANKIDPNWNQSENPEGQNDVEQHAFGTGLIGSFIKRLFGKKDEEQQSRFTPVSSILDNIKNANLENLKPSSATPTMGGEISDFDKNGDGKFKANVDGEYLQYKKGSDGSVEPDTSDAKTKDVLNKKSLREKLTDKYRAASLAVNEKIGKLFEGGKKAAGIGSKLFSGLLLGSYLIQSGILGKVFNGLIKPLWTDHIYPWVTEKAAPWIVDKAIKVKDFVTTKVAPWIVERFNIVKTWVTDKVWPFLRDRAYPFITEKVAPAIAKAVGFVIGNLFMNLPKFLVGGVKNLNTIVTTAIDTALGNTSNVGASTTIEANSAKKNLTDTNGNEISSREAAAKMKQDSNYVVYNKQGAKGKLNEDGTITFDDKSKAGSNLLKKIPKQMLNTMAHYNLTGGLMRFTNNAVLGAADMVGKVPLVGKYLKTPANLVAKTMTAPSQFMLNTLDNVKAGSNIKKAVVNAGKDVVGTDSFLGKMLSRIKSILSHVFNNEKVAKTITKTGTDLGVEAAESGKWYTKIIDGIQNIIAKFVKQGAEEATEESAKSAAKVASRITPFGIAVAVADFLSGLDKAESILGILDPGPIETAVAGIMNMVLGLVPFLQLFVSPIAQAIVRLFDGQTADAFKKRQEEAEEYAKRYNAEHGGTTYSTAEVLEREKSVTGKIKSTLYDTIGSKIKKAFGDGGRAKTSTTVSTPKGNVTVTNSSANFWMNYAGMGTGKYGMGPGGRYSKQIDPSIANIRYNSGLDQKYQTIGDSACGPAAAVNAVEAFGRGSDDIAKAAKFAISRGYKETNGGTKPGFFADYFNQNGLGSQTTTSKAELAKNISNGRPTVLMGQDKNGVSSRTPFGRTPHYVTVTGVDKNGHAIVQDPEVNRDNQLYDINDLMKKTKLGISAYGKGAKYGMGIDSPYASKIWGFLKSKGLSDEAAAGVMGNWQRESSLNPRTVEGHYLSSYPGDEAVFASTDALNDWTVNGLFPAYARSGVSINKSGYQVSNGQYWPGFGLAQWTGPRAEQVINYAKNNNMDWGTLEAQLSFFNQEFDSRALKDKMNAAGSAYDAASVFLDNFEMSPGFAARNPSQAQARGGFANEVFDKFKGTNGESVNINAGSSSSGSTDSGSSSEGSSGVIGALSNVLSNSRVGKALQAITSLGSGSGTYGRGLFGEGSAVDSNNAQQVYAYFREKGFTPEGAAGILGNMQHESGMEPTRVQGDYSSGYTKSREYTQQVDSGAIDRSAFANGGPGGGGYGLVQFTWHTYKEALYDNAKKANKSIGDLGVQLDTLYSQLGGIMSQMQNASDAATAANIMLEQYEKPADIPGTRPARVATANEYLNMYKDKNFKYTGKSSVAPVAGSSSSDTSSSSNGDSSSILGMLTSIQQNSRMGKALQAFLGSSSSSSSSSGDSGDSSSTGGSSAAKGDSPTGNKVIQAAASKLGYHEGYNNDTEFGRWYGLNNQPWCAMFVSWAAHEAGVPESIIPKTAAVATFESMLPQLGAAKVQPEDARTGDIINFGGNVHTGLVEDSSNGELHTIEGNSSDQVIRRTYPYNYSTRTISIWHPKYGDEGQVKNSKDNTQFAEFNSEVDDINNTLGSNPNKPLAKYGQFKESNYGMGNGNYSNIKTKDGFSKVESTEGIKEPTRYGTGASGSVTGSAPGTERTKQLKLDAALKLLSEIAGNTEELATIRQLLKDTIKATDKQIANAQKSKNERKSKKEQRFRGYSTGASGEDKFSRFKEKSEDQSIQSLVQAMAAIAGE